jgi:5-methylcytosine-specific restriction endonuclease McrA
MSDEYMYTDVHYIIEKGIDMDICVDRYKWKREAKSAKKRKERNERFESTPERKEYRKQYNAYYSSIPENKEKAKARLKEYFSRPEVQQAERERSRERHLKSRYGITLAEKNRLLEMQGGCALCGTQDPRSKIGWHVDHIHGRSSFKGIRGILCPGCNHWIGQMERNHITNSKVGDLLAYYFTTVFQETQARLRTIKDLI